MPEETCAPLPVVILDPGPPAVCPTYFISPQGPLADWGDEIVLFIPEAPGFEIFTFGTQPGTVALLGGPLKKKAVSLSVVSWQPKSIRVVLPSQAPFEGPYFTSVQIPGLATSCEGGPVLIGPTKLVLETIHCNEPEDVSGDELHLLINGLGEQFKVLVNGELKETTTDFDIENPNEMNEGDDWNPGIEIVHPPAPGIPDSFRSKVEIRLVEEDLGFFLDPDDPLGSHIIDPAFTPVGPAQVARFTASLPILQNPEYILRYRVLPLVEGFLPQGNESSAERGSEGAGDISPRGEY